MTTPELILFIKEKLQTGSNKDALTNMLIGQGWTIADINEAFSIVDNQIIPTQVISNTNTSASTISSQPEIQDINNNQKSYSKYPLKILSIIIIIILLGGITTYGYFNGYLNIFAPKLIAQEILRKTIPATLTSMKAFAYIASTTGTGAMTTSTNFNPLGTSTISYNLSLTGSVDYSVLENPLNINNITALISTNDGTTTGSINLSIDSLIKDQTMYMKLNDFNIDLTSKDPKMMQTQMLIGMVNGFVSSIKNKWIKADKSELKNTIPATSTLSTSTINMVKDYLDKMSFIQSAKIIGTEDISNIQTYHIQFVMQGDDSLINIISNIADEKMANDQKSLAEFDANLSNNIAPILKQKITIDMWVGKDDMKTYKIKTNNILINDPIYHTTSSAAYELQLSDFGKKVNIDIPNNVTTVQELIKQIFGGMMSTSSVPIKSSVK